MKNNSKMKVFEAEEFNNVKELIHHSCDIYSEYIAFVIKNKNNGEVSYTNITYKRFLEDINSLGTAFYSMGLQGKRVAIVGKNRYEWALTHMANLLGNIISVPLDKELQLEELESSIIRSKADVVVFDPKLLKLLEEIQDRKKAENVSKYICMDKIDGYTSISELLELGNKLIGEGNREYIDHEIDENTMNILLFTSGTTSKSKAVMLSHKNVASNIYALQCVEDVRPKDTNIAFLPFHHIFGSTGLLMMLASGVRTVFPDGLKYIKQNMQEYGVSVFVGVPALVEAMYKAVQKEIDKQGKTKLVNTMVKISNFLLKFHIDLRRVFFKKILSALGGKLRLIVLGGAAADPVSVQGFYELGVLSVQGYGLSETAPVVAAENNKARKFGSVGYPMINNEVEVVNKDEDGFGEIRVKGPNVMLGYYEMPELTSEVIRDGWFYTGDLGYIDDEGFLFITGRSKNLIVLKNGKKVFPEELETMVNKIELVSESMVYGMPDSENPIDVKVSVKIVYNEDVIKEKYADKTEEELKELVWEKIKEVNTTFPNYKHIKNLITSHEELIKTTTKKVKRQEEMKLIMKENKM